MGQSVARYVRSLAPLTPLTFSAALLFLPRINVFHFLSAHLHLARFAHFAHLWLQTLRLALEWVLRQIQYDGSKDDLDWRVDFKYLNFI